MKKAIVTGASGFIGKQLVAELLSRNVEVVAIDIRFDDVLLNNAKVTCINCADKSPFDLEESLKVLNADTFFHLAWAGTSGQLRADYSVQLNNVKLACDYVMLSSKIGCKRFVYASSINEMETYEYLQSDDINPSGGYIYGVGKLAAHLMGETVAKLNGVEFIPVIITNIYGAGEKSARLVNTSIRQLLNKEHCSFTEGKQTYDFIYITDAIASIVKLQLDRVQSRLDDRKIKLNFDQSAMDFLCEAGYDPDMGARPVKRAIQNYVENALAKALLSGKIAEGDEVNITAGQDELIIK